MVGGAFSENSGAWTRIARRPCACIPRTTWSSRASIFLSAHRSKARSRRSRRSRPGTRSLLRGSRPAQRSSNTRVPSEWPSQAIEAGRHVHIHNVMADLPVAPPTARSTARATTAKTAQRSFDGYVRPDGRVATRNYVGIVTTVNCSATVARLIAAQFNGERLARFAGVDGVVALAHASGCAMSKSSEGFRVLRRTLAGYARHPNFAGVLILGLGCEQNQTADLLEDFSLKGEAAVDALVIQEAGGTRPSVEAGVKSVERLLERACAARREPVSASHLKLALECGGSDGYSGISANPALGAAADLLVAHGGDRGPFGDAGDHRRRACTDSACRIDRGRPAARGAGRLVARSTRNSMAFRSATTPRRATGVAVSRPFSRNPSVRWRNPAPHRSWASTNTHSPSTRRAWSSWIRPATTR